MQQATVQQRMRWMFIVWMLVGAHLWTGCGTSEQGTEEEDVVQATERELRFTDVTQEAGLGSFRHVTGAFGKLWFPEIVGGGAGFFDYDGDGWQDIVLVRGGVWEESAESPVPALAVYRNLGDGTFADVTADVGLAGLYAYGMGVAIADYDNDADPDIFLSTVYRNLLLRNDGGTFREVGLEAGLGAVAEWSTSALFFDADLD